MTRFACGCMPQQVFGPPLPRVPGVAGGQFQTKQVSVITDLAVPNASRSYSAVCMNLNVAPAGYRHLQAYAEAICTHILNKT